MKLNLNNTMENEIDIEKEWQNLQNVLKSAANESLVTTKRRNRRKYLKVWDDQLKQLIETQKNHIKMAESKETRRQTGIQKKHSTCQNRSKTKTKNFLGQISYRLRT
jgi:septum formation inhibitor MinC